MIVFLLFSLVACNWLNSRGGNEQNSKSFEDVGPPIQDANWAYECVSSYQNRSNLTHLIPVGFGIGPQFVVMFYTKELKLDEKGEWNYTLFVTVFKREGGSQVSRIFTETRYIGHSIDDKGSIYVSCFQPIYLQHNRINSPRIMKLDSTDGSLIWMYQDFEDGNVTNPVVSPDGSVISACVGENYVILSSVNGVVKKIRPDSLCGADDAYLWGSPLFLYHYGNLDADLYGIDDGYCRESNERIFDANFIVKSKVNQNVFYAMEKGTITGGKVVSNGSVTLFVKKDYPNNECFMVYHTSAVWNSPLFLGRNATISVDSSNAVDVLLISTPTLNVQPVEWTTRAISWKTEPAALWTASFNQGASQNSVTYAVIDRTVGKYNILNSKLLRKVPIPLPATWNNGSQFSGYSYRIMGVASHILYISVAGYPVDKALGAVYGLVSLVME